MAHLEIKSRHGSKQLELDGGALTVGRFPDNDLVLPDDQASRHHCVIEPWQDGFRVRDLKSSNGTRLNNRKIAEEVLDNGDVVRIGATELRFIDPAAASRRRQDTRLLRSAGTSCRTTCSRRRWTSI